MSTIVKMEVGQYWRHDGGGTIVTIWEVVGLTPEALNGNDNVTIKLLADERWEPGDIEVGGEITYYMEGIEKPPWTLIPEEDLPMHILGML